MHCYNGKSVRHRSRRSGFSSRTSHTKDSKIVLNASLLNTQHFKVRIKNKWSDSGKKVAASPTSRCSRHLKESLRLPSTTVS